MLPRFENLVAEDSRVETYAKQYADVLKLCATLCVEYLVEHFPELRAVKDAYHDDKSGISCNIYEEFYIHHFDEPSDNSVFISDFEAMLKFETMDISVIKNAILGHYEDLYDRLLDVYQTCVDEDEIDPKDVDFNDVFIEFMITFTPIEMGEIDDVESILYTLDDKLDEWFDTCVKRVINER